MLYRTIFSKVIKYKRDIACATALAPFPPCPPSFLPYLYLLFMLFLYVDQFDVDCCCYTWVESLSLLAMCRMVSTFALPCLLCMMHPQWRQQLHWPAMLCLALPHLHCLCHVLPGVGRQPRVSMGKHVLHFPVR
jgi:hypothetical protein